MAATKTQGAWTDDQIGVLLDMADCPAPEVGQAIGRSARAIHMMRSRIKAGWIPLSGSTSWDDDEIEIVRRTAELTAREVSEMLGTRSVSAVNMMRYHLRASEGLSFGGVSRHDPFAVGSRRLLAKTCLGCGLLLDASWFYMVGTGRRRSWDSRCARCRPKSEATRAERNGRRKPGSSDSQMRLQELTLPGAKRKRYPWLEADHVVLRDSSLSNFEKALKLQRTYRSVCGQVHKHRYTSRVGKGDPLKGVWVIDNPMTSLAVSA